MPFIHAARHLSVRGRMAHRRIRQVLEHMTAARVVGPLTALFSLASVASHVMVTWGVLAFVPTPLPDAANDPLVSSRFLYPLMQQRPRPQEERIRFVGVGGPRTVAEPAQKAEGSATGAQTESVSEMVASLEPPESIASEPFEAFSELEVDITAARDPESEGPSYPDSLLARHVEGEARVRFVIDSTGHAITESFAVLETNHSGFADAVRLALPRMKYRPASMGVKPVAQRVEQTFVFKITRPPIRP